MLSSIICAATGVLVPSLVGLSDGTIEALVAGARTVSSKLTEILIFPMGGAIARVRAEATAFGDRSASWAVWVASQWTDPAEDEIHRDWTREFSESLAPWKTGRRLRQCHRRRRNRGAEASGVRRTNEIRAATGAQAHLGSRQPLPP